MGGIGVMFPAKKKTGVKVDKMSPFSGYRCHVSRQKKKQGAWLTKCHRFPGIGVMFPAKKKQGSRLTKCHRFPGIGVMFPAKKKTGVKVDKMSPFSGYRCHVSRQKKTGSRLTKCHRFPGYR